MIRYGAHISSNPAISISSMIQGCVDQHQFCMQFFLGDSRDSHRRRNISLRDSKKCVELCQLYNFRVYTHFPYLMKLVAVQSISSLAGLQNELDAMAPFQGRVVIHPNSSPGDCCITNRNSSKSSNLQKYTDQSISLAKVLKSNLQLLRFPIHYEYPLLLEPPAGEGTKFGWSFEHFSLIMEQCRDLPVGFCIDTCHTFCAGLCKFDSENSVNTFFKKLEDLEIATRVKVIHFNDSQHEFGSLKDRHAPIGHGAIWNNPAHVGGLVGLFKWSAKYKIDIICEVGDPDDLNFCQQLTRKVLKL